MFSRVVLSRLAIASNPCTTFNSFISNMQYNFSTTSCHFKSTERQTQPEPVFPNSHYDVLQVSVFSTCQEIKKQYFKLAQLYHPDKCTNEEDTREFAEKFAKINEAYKILSDEKQKEMYDRKLGIPRRFKSSFLSMKQKMKEERKMKKK